VSREPRGLFNNCENLHQIFLVYFGGAVIKAYLIFALITVGFEKCPQISSIPDH
jgi:hypothetical protein